jgi:hypothetical protein
MVKSGIKIVVPAVEFANPQGTYWFSYQAHFHIFLKTVQ